METELVQIAGLYVEIWRIRRASIRSSGLVGKAQMMADFMDQDVAHQMGQIFFGFAPVIQQRTAIEKNHIRSVLNAGFSSRIEIPEYSPIRSNGLCRPISRSVVGSGKSSTRNTISVVNRWNSPGRSSYTSGRFLYIVQRRAMVKGTVMNASLPA